MENRAQPGRPMATSQQENRVADYFNWNPSMSLDAAKRDAVSSGSSFQRILRNRLNMFLYKILILQELKDCDYGSRATFPNLCLKTFNSIPPF